MNNQGSKSDAILETAWRAHEEAVVMLNDEPVGTIAARDPERRQLNYDQVFIRDFVPSALAYLNRGESAVVRNFLCATLALQQRDRHMACFKPGYGLMPASFSIARDDGGGERLVADFGERAIGRVTPVDSALWWMFTLRAYVRATGDHEFARRSDVQHAMHMILEFCLIDPFDIYPTMLVPDGAFMIDRRLGVYGHPLEIQALLKVTLRCALELLEPGKADGDAKEHVDAARARLESLTSHIRNYYWMNLDRLSSIYQSRTDEYGDEIGNRFNIYPQSIPPWLPEWLPDTGGYLVGNLGPGRMDFRFFTQGNMLSILTGLADSEQSRAILELVDRRWDDLIGTMPVKICYPALETFLEWRLITGGDPKNAPWSYHNGGHWPVLLWSLVAAALRHDRPDIAESAIAKASERLVRDDWPEYYDGRYGRLIGRRARRQQTWTMSGFILASQLIEEPGRLELIAFDADDELGGDVRDERG